MKIGDDPNKKILHHDPSKIPLKLRGFCLILAIICLTFVQICEYVSNRFFRAKINIFLGLRLYPIP